jgi:uncharacterized membrane protein
MEITAKALDAVGVAVIVLGSAYTTLRLVTDRHRSSASVRYTTYRTGIGRAILLGLEFLIAADIVRTVAVSPTFEGVAVLALIVLVRTFLSFTLELELEGRLPWGERAKRRSGPSGCALRTGRGAYGALRRPPRTRAGQRRQQ